MHGFTAEMRPGGRARLPARRHITDWCLQQFRQKYPALQIDKDDIWHYIYGLLHAPDYREKYRADLSKDLPRIPFAPDFGAFRDAGEQLAALHLGYETCAEYALQVEVSGGPNPYQLDSRKMQWDKGSDRSVLQVTPAVTLRGIPAEAHGYMVNGRTPLEWAVERLHIRHDDESGIVNDPNAWFADDPAELVAHLKRLVHVSVETTRVVDGLPPGIGGLKNTASISALAVASTAVLPKSVGLLSGARTLAYIPHSWEFPHVWGL